MRKVFAYSLLFTTLLCFTAFAQKNKAKEPLKVTEKTRVEIQDNFFLGQKEKMLGNDEKAEEYFTKLAVLAPNEATAFYELALLHNKKNNFTQALSFAQTAYNNAPKNEWMGAFYAELLGKNGDIKTATKIYNGLIANAPNNKRYYIDYARLLLTSNEEKAGIAVLENMEKQFGPSNQLLLLKKDAYVKMGKNDLALKEVEKMVALKPGDAKMSMDLAKFYLGQNEAQKAILVLQKSKIDNPSNENLNLMLADAYSMNDQPEAAFSELKSAFGNPSLDIDAKIAIMMGYLQEPKLSLSRMDQLAQLAFITKNTHPINPKSHAMYGDAMQAKGDKTLALEAYRKATTLDKSPQKYAIWQQILLLDLETYSYRALEKDADEALEYFPSQAMVYYMSGLAKNKNFNYQGSNAILKSGMSYILDETALTADFYALMGNNYLKLKDYKLSIEHYKKALNMVADDQMTIRNELAFAQSYEPAMLKNAQSIIEACLEVQPLNSDFLNTYAVILSKQGQHKEAEIKIEKALELAPNQIEKAKYLETKGDILYRKGEVNAAVSFWEKAEKMGVKSSAIHTKISTLQLAE